MTTTTEILTPDRVRRIALLHASGNESAKLCAVDAAVCLMNAESDEFDGWTEVKAGIARQTWINAADQWIARGASHVWGWPRNNPAGW